MNKFFCDKCGLCCRHIKGIKELEGFDKGNGVCKYLDEKTNLCEIYENRPLICRVDDMYHKYFNKIYSKQEYYKLNYNACKKLKGE